MKKANADYNCIKCLINKNLNINDINISDENKTSYFKEALLIISSMAGETTAPEIVEKLTELQQKYHIQCFNYTEIKKHYNKLILNYENELFKKIINSSNPLLTAVKFSLIGNYIDFGTNINITEENLFSLIENSDNVNFNTEDFLQFKEELKRAKNIVLLTDNCGEVVFDKLLVRLIKSKYKDVNFKVIVRGKAVLNDIIYEDAVDVGLNTLVDIIDNGTGIAGTVLEKINNESRLAIENADIILSKGMGNFETLVGCNKNIYYIFMCKCEKFCSLFNVPLYTYMFLNEKRLKL